MYGQEQANVVGFCLSEKHDERTKPAIGAALVAHRLALFLSQCEHSGVVQMDAVLIQAFKIEKAKTFYDEMTPQVRNLGQPRWRQTVGLLGNLRFRCGRTMLSTNGH